MTTELTVNRQPSATCHTAGELLWDGAHQCYTCEDVIREVPGEPVETWKIDGETAIPAGRYQLAMTWSDHFDEDMPEVLNVPGFTGVRIHTGNDEDDTEGCLLVGTAQTPAGVSGSGDAFGAFLPKLEAALAAGEVWITYNNPADQAAVRG